MFYSTQQSDENASDDSKNTPFERTESTLGDLLTQMP